MPYRINRQTGGADYINATTGHTLSSNTVQTPAQGGGGFFKSAANFLMPRTSQLLKKAKAGINLSALTDQAEEDRKKRQQLIERIIRQAKQEADPDRRSALLAQARDLSQEGTQQVKSAINNFEEESGTKIGDKERVIAEALGVAGELGTFLIPAGKLTKAAKTGKLVSRSAQIAEGVTATKRILKGAKLGAGIGAVSALTDPEKKTGAERATEALKGAGVGALTGGAISAAFEVPRAAVVKFLKSGSNKGTLARIFRVSASKKKDFRQATGGLDFEEELLTREAQSISGMNHEQLLQHFQGRAKDANRALEDLLVGSTKTVNRQSIITSLQSRISSLAPEKGAIGAAGARNQLQGIIDELALLPDDEISLVVANKIKRQLQDIGSAAFSPSGKATVTSKAIAGASGTIKNAIEKAAQKGKENTVKEANRNIQLYRLAKDAIENVGDAEIKKISSGFLQKFLQQIPAAAIGVGGIGGFAAGGPLGAAGGVTLAAALVGGVGAARLKFLSPQVQTSMISKFSGVLENQGVQFADRVATRIVQEMSKQLSRQATLTRPDEVEPGLGLGPQIEEDEDRQVEQQLQGIPGQQTDTTPQDDLVHEPEVSQTVTIRNKKTGETRQIQRNELSNFGLAGDAQDAIPGLPSKSEILAAMVLDLQKGGKNISKLNTVLDAYKKVGIGVDEEGLDLTENQKKQLSNLSKSQDIVRRLGQEAGSIIDPEDTALKARFKGTSLKALSTLGLISDRETQAKVSAFKKVRKGMRVQIARGLGEVGNLSEPEQRAALDLLPDITMSQDEIDENIRLIQEIIDLAKARVTEFSGGAPVTLETSELLQ